MHPLMLRARRARHPLAAGALLALALAAPGQGADGVLELDPFCAAVGCFPGDAPGYPIEITLPGSYKLTGNLDVRGVPNAPTVEAIEVFAPSVTLDLAGFLVVGPVVCSGSPPSCAPDAPSAGIHLFDDADAAVVRNGVVSGFGFGVYTNGPTDFARVENVVTWSNRYEGIFGGGVGAQIVGVTAFLNGRRGVWVGQAASVRRSTLARNGQEGILAGPDALIVDNTVYDNGLNGVHGSGRSLYARNVISENSLEGLRDDGGGALAYGNTLTNNVPFGILFGGIGSAYTENVMSGQPISVSGGLSLGQNACNGGNC